jgi:hypothetical protein
MPENALAFWLYVNGSVLLLWGLRRLDRYFSSLLCNE